MLKISAFYLDKQKSFITKKIWRVPCTMHSSFFSQQMQYCLATLLVYMALALPYQAWPSSPYKPLSCQTLRQPQFLSKFQSLLYANFKFMKLIWFICLRIWTTHQYFLNKSYLHHGPVQLWPIMKMWCIYILIIKIIADFYKLVW